MMTLKEYANGDLYIELKAEDNGYIVGLYEYGKRIKETVYGTEDKANKAFYRACRKYGRA